MTLRTSGETASKLLVERPKFPSFLLYIHISHPSIHPSGRPVFALWISLSPHCLLSRSLSHYSLSSVVRSAGRRFSSPDWCFGSLSSSSNISFLPLNLLARFPIHPSPIYALRCTEYDCYSSCVGEIPTIFVLFARLNLTFKRMNAMLHKKWTSQFRSWIQKRKLSCKHFYFLYIHRLTEEKM